MSDKKKYEYLIIGADAAGLSAAVQIRRNQKNATIGILERGDVISYGACGLPYAIQGKVDSFESLIHFTPAKFAGQYQVDIHIDTRATSVDFSSKTVETRNPGDNKDFKYEKLIIATGAEPSRLPFLDYSSSRIMELKTVPDGIRIKENLENFSVKRVAIIGAGYIGLEMTDVLRSLGMEVVLLDAAPRPVPRMPEDISRVIEKKAKENNVETHFGISISGSTVTDDGVLLKTSVGDIKADIVISAIGIRPATDFLENSGIKMDRGALIVDQKCRTSMPDVFAAGDCSLVYHRLIKKNVWMPLGSTANKQGRIAGMNASGEEIEFPGIIGTQIFKFFDIVCAKTGLSTEEAAETGKEARSYSAIRPGKASYYPEAGKVTTHLTIADDGTILGGHMTGPLHLGSMIDTVGAMAQCGMNARDAAFFDAAYAPPVAPVWNATISAAGKFGRNVD